VNQKIDIAIKLPNKQQLVDSEFTRQQYTVHNIFYVRTLKIFTKYRRIADFNYCSPCLTARYRKCWKVTATIFGSLTDGPA